MKCVRDLRTYIIQGIVGWVIKNQENKIGASVIVYFRQLGEKLPNNVELEVKEGDTVKLTGAIELHRLAVEDLEQLKKRAEEINEAIVNATCSVDDGDVIEVRQETPPPLFFPGHTVDARLQVQSLGLGAPAAEQGCGSQQSWKGQRWRCGHPLVLRSSIRFH